MYVRSGTEARSQGVLFIYGIFFSQNKFIHPSKSLSHFWSIKFVANNKIDEFQHKVVAV
jgi:hypothetical protein